MKILRSSPRHILPLLTVLAATLSACAPQTKAPPATSRGEAEANQIGVSSSGQYLAARIAMSEHDTLAAAQGFDKALAFDPDNVELLTRAFVLMAAEGRMDRAAELAKRLLTFDPEAANAAFVLIVQEMKRGNAAAAEKLLAPLPRRGLSSFLVPLLMGWTLAAQNKTEAAIEALKPMRDMAALAPLHDFHAGLINDLAGRNDEAHRHYANAMAGPAGLTLRGVRVVGSFYARSGRTALAKSLFDRYRTENPDTALLDPMLGGGVEPPTDRPIKTALEGMAEAFFGASGSLRQANAPDMALMLARLGEMLQGDSPLSRLQIGGLLEDMGRLEDANQLYTGIPANDPLSWPVRVRMAENLNRLKKTGEAIHLLEQLAKERIDRSDPLISLGDVLRAEKRWTEAADAYDRAIKRTPKIEKRHWGLLYARGIAYERDKQWKKAEADFQRALQLEPEQPFVLNYLGYSWVEQGIHLDKARAMIEKAVALRPTDGYIIDSLGWVLYRLGDLPGAVKQMERAVELRPEDPTINDHLGDVYWKIGRKLEAKFQWQHALTLNPEPELVAGIKAKIDKGL
jgi:tetratricopeptide (TPR) repeat protein